jgi:hypothetical protein
LFVAGAFSLPIFGVPNAQDTSNIAPSASFHHNAIWAVRALIADIHDLLS